MSRRREFSPVVRRLTADYMTGWQVGWALVDEEWTRSYLASSHQGCSGPGVRWDTEGGYVTYRLDGFGEGRVSLKELVVCAVAAVADEDRAELLAIRAELTSLPEAKQEPVRVRLRALEDAVWERTSARLRAVEPEVGPWEQLPLFAAV